MGIVLSPATSTIEYTERRIDSIGLHSKKMCVTCPTNFLSCHPDVLRRAAAYRKASITRNKRMGEGEALPDIPSTASPNAVGYVVVSSILCTPNRCLRKG